MTDFITNLFNNKTSKSEIHYENINEDLKCGIQLQSKRKHLIKSLAKNTNLIEGFSNSFPLQTLDQVDFNEIDESQENMMRETSSLSTLFKTTMHDYTKSRSSVKDCRDSCNKKFSKDSGIDEINIGPLKKACLAGCSLAKVYLEETEAKAIGVKGENISDCSDLKKDGEYFCKNFIKTRNCRGDGDYNGTMGVAKQGQGCNTTIPSNISGKCYCKDGTVKAQVDCGHDAFNCNEVCRPNGKPYVFNKSVDCKVSNFGEWSRCNKNCGTGTETRKRSIITKPIGGKSCPALSQTRNCKIKNCMVRKCVPVQRIMKMKGTSRNGDFKTWESRCKSIGDRPSWEFWLGGCTSRVEYPIGSGGRCEYREVPVEGFSGKEGFEGILYSQGLGKCEGKTWFDKRDCENQNRKSDCENRKNFAGVKQCNWEKRKNKKVYDSKNPNKTSHIASGEKLKDTCSVSKSNTATEMGDAANLETTFRNLGYQETFVNEKAQQLQSRINRILTSKKNLWELNDPSSQELMDELTRYQAEYKLLKRLKLGESTLQGMEEDSKLKQSSAHIKYIFWLGLAICTLMIVIKQLK